MMQIEKAALERIMAGLDNNVPARKTPLSEDELPLVRGLQLLTMKPVRGTSHFSAFKPLCAGLYTAESCQGLPAGGPYNECD